MMGNHVDCVTGIDRSRVEDMENRLRADVLREVRSSWLLSFFLLVTLTHPRAAAQCQAQPDAHMLRAPSVT